jgi:hypothetical protein
MHVVAISMTEFAFLHVCLIVAYSTVLLGVVRKKLSSCLKEVEKIKQRREERRAAQQALREQQEQEYDTSAPNWEFEAMIRCLSAQILVSQSGFSIICVVMKMFTNFCELLKPKNALYDLNIVIQIWK